MEEMKLKRFLFYFSTYISDNQPFISSLVRFLYPNGTQVLFPAITAKSVQIYFEMSAGEICLFLKVFYINQYITQYKSFLRIKEP